MIRMAGWHLLTLLAVWGGNAWGGEPAAPRYATPLAGDAGSVDLLGQQVRIPARDRGNTLALTLGGTLFAPALGSADALPVAALYGRRETPHSRSRLVFGVFVNELDHAHKFDNFEILAHLENTTVPFPATEIVGGREVRASSVVWGQAAAWVGAGYRLPVAPLQVDNDLRLQLFYEGGYLYSSRTVDSGADVRLPPDTVTHGVRLRGRYDGMRRNIMELLHQGVAGGLDVEWQRRAHWADANYGGADYRKDETQEFVKLSGYLMAAAPVPGLSERDRLIFSVYGGTTAENDLDRFSAFHIGGGPFPCESDDLARIPYPGAEFNQFPVSDYIVGTAEYRRELLFFLYLHLRGTFAWANRDVLSTHPLRFHESRGQALSVGLTSGLPWDSTLYLEYSYDSGILRNGVSGSSLSLLWSKSL
ncbi:hypothetical protein FO488_00840 [Geobacter sp. FeAm09]|uniref:hypothetical protein n=1 Tax=Geobacter sp. FeAm09 TaxID=2597769 RepID=UPI0011F013AF|nr:hypothetical protein [Geobacter sp. FeAm09]QEM66844.1 hypothetical protein FO488_00840 [Geobacter sp. FeAm09]